MRRLILMLLFVALAFRAHSMTRVTEEQLEKTIAASSGKSDAEMAGQISVLRLTDRLSERKFSALLAGLPGPLSRQALLAVADLSGFQPPRKDEIPATPAPDDDTRSQIIARANDYLNRTIPTLPDFIATRHTVRYQDRLLTANYNANNIEPDLPLEVAERSTGTVLYRNHREVTIDSVKQAGPAAGKPGGLHTDGAFGAILGTVLADTARTPMKWSRWEQDDSGRVAVFHFAVSQRDSHYLVSYCCVPTGNARRDSRVDRNGMFEERSGYRGELGIDPETGTILRLVLHADLAATLPIDEADILVMYEPVEIGGKTYICPLKSISVSQARARLDMVGYNYTFVRGLSVTMLTDTLFESYHRFRGDVRILTGDYDAQDKDSDPGAPLEPAGVPDPPQ